MAHLCGLGFFWDCGGGSALSIALEPVFGYSWGQSMTVVVAVVVAVLM